jgi:hypothetical protein
VHKGIEVAHANLDRHGVLKGCCHGAIKKKKALKPSFLD